MNTITEPSAISRANKKTELFVDTSAYPDLQAAVDLVATVTQQLVEERRQVRLTLGQPSLNYTTVLGTEVSGA